MPIQASDCTHCGAKIVSTTAAYCEYCGTVLPKEEPREPAKGERFDALLAHPDLKRLLALEPSSAGIVASGAFSVVFTMIFLGIAITLAFVFFGAASSINGRAPTGFGALFTIVPVIIVIVGVVALFKAIGSTAKVTGSPMRKVATFVVDKRTDVSGGGQNSRAQTQYFVTLEERNGQRVELLARDHVTGRLTGDDMGIAYIKGNHLVAFERVDV